LQQVAEDSSRVVMVNAFLECTIAMALLTAWMAVMSSIAVSPTLLHYSFHNFLSRTHAVCYISIQFVSVAHWHSARWAWNGYQPGLGSIPRPGRI